MINNIIQIINEKVKDINFNLEDIDVPFEQIGVSSIQFIQIIVTLEEFYKIEFPDECLTYGQLNTLMKIAKLLEKIF